MEDGGLAWWITFSIIPHGWLGVFVSHQGNTQPQDAQWEEGKSVEVVSCFGQSSAGKSQALPSMWMLLWHLPNCIIEDHARPLRETVLPDDSGLRQQDNAPCHKAKRVQGRFEERSNKFEVLTRSPKSRDFLSKYLWHVLDKIVQ